ncbi:MAG TPA: DUF4255 domain-containing protein [Verrucomicrobiota bacterium]|nr:hypothetical protein [Verrucomicrobiales bacterium]HRI12573.1 DUF4255 domain-containing protein [Verrucomicrobiota bacterium]
MIAEAISFLREQLNAHFGTFRELPTDLPVVMRALVDQRGEVTPGGEQGVSLTLVNVEEEIAARKPYAQRETETGFEIGPAALNLNLSVLVSAEFRPSNGPTDPEGVSKNYGRTLQSLTRAVHFFHSRPSFSPEDSPDLPKGIEKLIVRQVNLSIQEQQNLWAYLGAKYAPSVLYKISMLSLPADYRSRIAAPLHDFRLNFRSR